jgi:homoprotocatechuate degradation regulator HpaR
MQGKLEETTDQGLPPIAQSLPFALIRARENVMAPIRKMLAQSQVTEQQWRILRALSEHGPLEATKLSEFAILQLPSQTRILRSMELRGLVTRKSNEDDKRRQTVHITDVGQAIVDKHRASAAALAVRFQHVLGRRELDQLLKILKKLERV